MDFTFSRRGLMQGMAAVGGAVAVSSSAPAGPISRLAAHRHPGWVFGRMTGSAALAETLLAEGTECVYGIPGAQENELWDAFKEKGLPYLLVTHEFSAACMADAYGRSMGKPGVLCVVPGPGATNSLTGLGEALLDSSPVVAVVGDIAVGEKAHPFQVHGLDTAQLLKPVCKCVYQVRTVDQIPGAVRQAFAAAMSGEPGPVAVVVPYNLLIEAHDYRSPPTAPAALPFDDAAFSRGFALLADKSRRVGIYAGMGCMAYRDSLVAIAELLQAPVATSVSGKGAIDEAHPLAVGWGFGPHAGMVAETIFAGEALHPRKTGVETLLAIGVKFSEVSTGFYGNPQPARVVHVDANADNLGRILRTDVCVHADAGVFLGKLLACGDHLRRPIDRALPTRIAELKAESARAVFNVKPPKCGVDPLALIGSMRRAMPDDGMLFVDVTVTEHLAAEHYTVRQPRTYFNPVDNQAMGWSVPAAIGAQRAQPAKKVATITGDGCLLMTAMEITTSVREGLPVKFFILDDRAYHYMQLLQLPAYLRTTATVLARMDYRALAQAFGVAYQEITSHADLDAKVQGAICHPSPVLVRVLTDYGNTHVRWLDAVRKRYTKELTAAQKARFLGRIGMRAIRHEKDSD